MGNDLAQRVATQNGRNGNGGGEVERRKPATLTDQIRNMQAQFELAMPRGAEARQLVRDALTLLRQNPKLANCTSESVLGGLMTFAQLGLRPGVMGHGWLLPFEKRAKQGNQWVTTHWEAQIVIGYKGLAELVHRSGQIATMVGRAVHENDQFELEYGLTDQLVHRPAKGVRGAVVGYYAIIKYQGGGYVFWHMSRDEAVEWRNAHAMSAKKNFKTGEIYGSGPWFDEVKGPDGGTGFDMMAIKTCALRAMRWAPKATDTQFAKAAEVDGTVRLNVDTDPDAILNSDHPETPNGVVLEGDLDVPAPGEAPGESHGPSGEDMVREMNREEDADSDGAQWPPAERGIQTEFPAVAGNGSDGPALQSQQKRMHSALHDSGVELIDAQRWAVLARMAGRPRPVKSASELTKREAAQVDAAFADWRERGVLAEQVRAVLAVVTPDTTPPETSVPDPSTLDPENLPAEGTKAYHAAGHPRRALDGSVETADRRLDGSCGICESGDDQ